MGARGIWIRYLDPKKVDYFFYLTHGTLSGSMQSYDALDETCRGCHQPYWRTRSRRPNNFPIAYWERFRCSTT
jgi:hypothetical protein